MPAGSSTPSSTSTSAGLLFAPQRARSVDHDWKKPCGGQIDLRITRWGVKIENNLYLGENLQPLWQYYGPEGLYAGERFYSTTEHIYNRTWIGYDRKFFDDTMHVEAGMVFHYDGTGTGTQQMVKLSVDIQKAVRHRQKEKLTRTPHPALPPGETARRTGRETRVPER